MTNPDKVISFLDIFNLWDPSLIFVMIGAIFITSPTLYFLSKNNTVVLNKNIQLPSNKNVDKPLIFGSFLFGIGWGMIGLCPCPAIASIAFLDFSSITFVICMFIGLYISKFIKL